VAFLPNLRRIMLKTGSVTAEEQGKSVKASISCGNRSARRAKNHLESVTVMIYELNK
jgi:hypothetical protein